MEKTNNIEALASSNLFIELRSYLPESEGYHVEYSSSKYKNETSYYIDVDNDKTKYSLTFTINAENGDIEIARWYDRDDDEVDFIKNIRWGEEFAHKGAEYRKQLIDKYLHLK